MFKKDLDLSLGLANEDKLFDTFKLYFNEPNLKKTKQFALSDYYSDTIQIELKTRRCRYDSFKTTIIGVNKCKFYSRLKRFYDIECYFSFHFLEDDTVYYIKYDPQIFKEFRREQTTITRDNKIEEKEHIHIPIKYLNKLIL